MYFVYISQIYNPNDVLYHFAAHESKYICIFSFFSETADNLKATKEKEESSCMIINRFFAGKKSNT